jgi:hypothetical protein
MKIRQLEMVLPRESIEKVGGKHPPPRRKQRNSLKPGSPNICKAISPSPGYQMSAACCSNIRLMVPQTHNLIGALHVKPTFGKYVSMSSLRAATSEKLLNAATNSLEGFTELLNAIHELVPLARYTEQSAWVLAINEQIVLGHIRLQFHPGDPIDPILRIPLPLGFPMLSILER